MLFVVKDEVSPRLLDSVGYYVGSTVVCVQKFFFGMKSDDVTRKYFFL